MGSDPNKYLALVKWVGGPDNKKYTPGIKITHIKNFDFEKFKNDDEDPEKVYVIEWRDTRKRPLGGWKTYNANVIAISDKMSVLEKKLKTLDGIQSPKRVMPKITLMENDSDDERIEVIHGLTTKTTNETDGIIAKKPKLTVNEKENIENEIQLAEKLDPLATKKVNDPVVDASDEKNDNSVYVTMDQLECALKNITQNYIGKSMEVASSSTSSLNKQSSIVNSHTSQVKTTEVGNPGSNVFIRADQLSLAEAAPSPTAMATALLVSVFPKSVLIVSNVKGGAPKNIKNPTVKNKALDSEKLKAIKDAVKKRFPRTYKESDINRAINVKCSRIRSDANATRSTSTQTEVEKDLNKDNDPNDEGDD